MLTPEDLDLRLIAPESPTLERKRSAGDRSAIRRAICALANDISGTGQVGIVVIGMEDDGACAGLTIDDALMQILANMRNAGSILPWPDMQVVRHEHRGCSLGVILVRPSLDPPVRYEGRVWVRVGSTTQLASPQDEQRLTERRRAADLPFDMRPAAGATLEDLDLEAIEKGYLPRAVSQDVLDQNQRPLQQQLASLRLTTSGVPDNAALIAFGRDPRAWVPGTYLQFVRFDGTTTTDSPIRDSKELSGPLGTMLRQVDELLELNLSVRLSLTAAPVEQRLPDYPLVALQQIVRNALMHRSYENTNAPVRLYWFSDRVEVHNPGALYGQVTRENFGTGVTDYRNPVIAEVMRNLGYVQRFGLGVPLAQETLRRNGNPPAEFGFEGAYVLAVVRAAP